MDERDGLQLLPGTKKRLGIKVPGENRFLYVGSAILGAVLVTMFSMSRYQTSLKADIDELNAELVSIEQRRNKQDEAELRITKDRLSIASGLIENHLYWTRVFEWIESMLQSEIQIKDISVTSDKRFLFSGWAANYIVISRQLAAFLNDDRVMEVEIGKMTSRSDGTVEFSMNITLDLDRIIKK